MNHPRLNHQRVTKVRRILKDKTVGLYIAAAFFYWISLYLYLPILPTFVQTKTESLALVGIVLSMYGLWQAIIRFPLGIVVDWLGRRKPFIISGLILAGLGAFLMGSADNATSLLVGRSVTGLAAAAWVPLLVAFSSLYPVTETISAASYLTFAGSAGRVSATSVTGTLITGGGDTMPFFLATGAAGAGILFILLTREEYRFRQLPSFKSITNIVTRRDVLLPSLLAAVTQYANWTSTFGFIPILAQRLGAKDVIQSMLVTTQLVVVIIGNLSVTFLDRRIGERRLVLLSFWMLAVGVGISALAISWHMLFIAQLLIGMSLGISYPVLSGLSIRYVRDNERNTALGLHQSVYAAGTFAGPWLSGILAQLIGLRWMLFATALCTLSLGLLGGTKLGEKP